MSRQSSVLRRDVISWSLYDFANTIYSMNIVSLYLKRYIVEDLGKDHAWFDIPFSFSMLLAALLLPALGAISDHSTRKKIFLFLFTATCCIAVGVMSLIPDEFLLGIIVLFIISNFSYEAGQPFYNSLLYSVSEGQQARFVSGIGVSLGYVGSVVGMIIVLPFVTGSLFSIELPWIEAGGKTAAFLPTALLFALFSLPLFLWVKEKEIVKPKSVSLKQGYIEVWEGLRLTKKYPGVLRFLIADYFIEDAATTVILNIGIYCSLVVGFSESQINAFLILSTISAVFGSFAIGRIAMYVSLNRLLRIIAIGWIIALVLFVVVDSMIVIWILGSVVGILLGGLWTTTRPLLAELVPREELGRFFGLFSLSGRAAAIIGPLLWTAILYLFDSRRAMGKAASEWLGLTATQAEKLPYHLGVLSLAIMMMIGLYIFRKVPDLKDRRDG